MKKQFALVALPLFSMNALAGGLLLSEVATFDSVSSAGVGNALNRKDASAAITSPAGLTSIEGTSYSFGVQYLDAANTFKGEGTNGQPLKTKASGQQFAPSLAYARRISDNTVLGTSLHAEGGLGMEYSHGLSGLNLMDEMSITAINLNFAAGYQVSPNLSLGGGIVIQHVTAEVEASVEDIRLKADGSSTEPGFMLSAMYDLSDNTYISANYKSQIKHRYKLKPNHNLSHIGTKTSWPTIADFGISHNLSDQLNLKVRLAYEDWKAYGKADNKTMENAYSIGAALSYSQDRWTYQAGFRYDTKMMKEKHMEPDLSIGRQWAFGLGAEKQLNNNHRLGIAYEYRDMGEPEVHYGLTDIKGKFSRNRLHFVSLSYAY